MHVNAINNYNVNNKYNNAPSFKSLIIDKSASKVIEQLSKEDVFEFQQIEKRLSKTKFWDMKISSIGNKFEELKFYFINKKSPRNVITDGIYSYDNRGKNIRFYTIVYGPENTSFSTVETLKFNSEKRAKDLFDTHKQNIQYISNRQYNLRPIERIKFKETELQMLEESAENAQKNQDQTLIDTNIRTKRTIGNEFEFNNPKK